MNPRIIVCTVPGCFNLAAQNKSAVIDADEVQRKRFEIRGKPSKESKVILA